MLSFVSNFRKFDVHVLLFFFYEQIKNFFLKEKSAFETGFLVQFYRGFILMIQRNSLYAFLLENMSTFC